MKILILIVTVLHLVLGASIVDVSCPDSCTCQVKDEHYETSCTSYEFIKKLMQKQILNVVRLNINNASLVTVDPKLKYLKSLNFLDLSNNTIGTLPTQFPYLPKLKSLNLSTNHLKDVTFVQLPKNLEVLDLSNNSISNLPKDWASLKQLKTLYLHNNPIDCVCSNLLIFQQLMVGGIDIPISVTCYYPQEVYGKTINSVNCSMITDNLLNSMLGDEEGSGAPELTTNFDDNSPIIPEEEYVKVESDSISPVDEQEDLLQEGSGEGSGLIPIEPIPIYKEGVKACNVNCSTPKPVGSEDEANASPPPSFKDRTKILLDDLFNFDKESTTSSTSTTTEVSPVKEEEPFVKESDKSQVETFPTNDTVLGEMERASVQDSNSSTTYIVVGLLIAFVAFLILYFIDKKRRHRKRGPNRKRNKLNENGFGEELKPLGKSAEKPVEIKPVENSKPAIPEQTPLLNGQNGKVNEENSLKPQEVEKTEPEPEPEVELRKPTKEELLTPQLERVTIKAGEIPDSIPKTPMLVHRQVTSDGEIITTAVPN